jgi:RNase P/RNase MRP subunit p29
MTTKTKRLCMGLTILGCLAVTAAAQTSTTERIAGSASHSTTHLSGVVVTAEGNTLVAKMPNGELRTFNVKESTKFVIDGRETAVRDLKPGTSLSATMITTTTPITERTTSSLTGTVWYVAGNTVILTLPDGTNKMYKAQPHFKFTVDGREAEVSDLRKGMRIAAKKIVEEPVSEVASNTTVTGSAPKPVVAQAPPPTPAPAPVRVAKAAPAPPPAPVEAAPAPAPAPAPAEPPAELPKSGSSLPLAGVLGLLFTTAGLALRNPRRSNESRS